MFFVYNNHFLKIFSVMSGSKSSEINWMMFEARIRQLVIDLVDPLEKK
jgi:hypothetical protein